MSPVLHLRSPAKLNLALHVVGRRADGYHLLQTVFQLIDLCDTMRFTPTDNEAIVLEAPLPGVADADNLVLRAARLLRETSGTRAGARIGLDKRIPMGAGLGGGSSNAATTLLALNRLWRCDLPPAELARLGATLGADVPVFVMGRNAFAEGVGDILTPVELPSRWFLVLHPGCAVNTAAIFKDPELTRDTCPMTMAGLLAGTARNDCEAVTRKRYPEVDQALAWLGQFGPARMSGTGSSVFLGFDSEAEASGVATQAPAQWRVYVARGLARSPVHEALIG